jgi:hypothetical protein
MVALRLLVLLMSPLKLLLPQLLLPQLLLPKFVQPQPLILANVHAEVEETRKIEFLAFLPLPPGSAYSTMPWLSPRVHPPLTDKLVLLLY